MAKSLLRRRGETTAYRSAPSDAAALLANRWQGFRVVRVQKHGRLGLIVCIILAIYIWTSVRKSDSYSQVTSRRQHDGRLVVALSTIPSRIHLLQPTLDSFIKQQTLQPDIIFLTLPQKKAHSNTLLNYTIPKFIRNYQRKGKLQILSPENDFGSIMKVLSVLEIESPDTRIVYVDDDWTYDKEMLQVLYNKSLQYPDSALSLNGGVLRNYFRQISHTNLEHNHHPYIFMETSGTNTLLGGKDHTVDIAQGFCGVLVKQKFFAVHLLRELLQQPNVPTGVIKSDDFILSSHLEYQNVTRILVDGGAPPSLTEAASIDKLSLHMYRHAMEAAHYLQHYWNIWQNYSFYNPTELSKEEWDAIDCEAGRGQSCDGYQQVLRELDQKFPP